MPTTMTPPAQLRCPTCGHTHSPRTPGLILRLRAAGHEVIPARFLGRCSVCDKIKFLIPEPAAGALPAPAFTADREQTLQELAAYVGESTVSIDTAESIAAAACPESRKRHIAALLAESVLTPAEAIRLLAL